MPPCEICSHNINTNSSKYRCGGECNKFVHGKCWKSNDVWKCSDCRNLISREDNVPITMACFKTTINQLKDDIIAAFEVRFTALENKMKFIEDRQVRLENEIKEIKSSKFNNSNDTLCDIINEMEDIKVKSKNAMIFNIDEPNGSDLSEKIKLDTAFINNIVVERGLGVKPIKVLRIGKQQSNRNRPIKIICESENDAVQLLRSNASDILPNFKFRSDKTQRQREYFQEIRNELNRRKQNGETNIVIKYRNSIPYIAKINAITHPKNLV